MTGLQGAAFVGEVFDAGAGLGAEDFAWVADFMTTRTGVELPESKQAMVTARLAPRARELGLPDLAAYVDLLRRGDTVELGHAIDLLTTNETWFFREIGHFDALRDVAAASPEPLRVWSAAGATGQEAYSAAMVLAAHSSRPGWEVLGTDVSAAVVEVARQGLYPIAQAARIPTEYLKPYCLRGRDEYEGYFTVTGAVRAGVAFGVQNLLEPLDHLGTFDVILLRNVMIYFSPATKRELLARIERRLNPGGLLMVGHSETLNDLGHHLERVRPSVHRKGA